MADQGIGGPIPVSRIDEMTRASQSGAARMAIAQEGIADELTEWQELGAFNPLAMARRFETLESRTKRRSVKEEQSAENKEEVEPEVIEIQKIEEVADGFHRNNPELQVRALLLLRARVKNGDTGESLLTKVLELYPDHSLADEAIDFLSEVTDGELAQAVHLAKMNLNETFGKEVRAGRNIAAQAREFSQQGLGSPGALRELYRSIIATPREPLALFNELTSAFSYEKMRQAILFILHSLGADLRSKGPSISRGELSRMLTEARSLQAILGIFRFFQSRMGLIQSAFARAGLALPIFITFELLARLYARYLEERYPSSERARLLGSSLGVKDDLDGLTILYTQMRDATRQVAPKLFRTPQHRQDVLDSFIDVLEELEEQEEEKEEEDKEKKQQQKKKPGKEGKMA